jgi:hypothetical protein
MHNFALMRRKEDSEGKVREGVVNREEMKSLVYAVWRRAKRM